MGVELNLRYSNEADTDRETAALQALLEVPVTELGMRIVELSVFRGKPRKVTARKGSSPDTVRSPEAISRGSVQVRLVVYKRLIGTGGSIGTDDCSKAHRAITPLLETEFPGVDLSIEVSSPGINRSIKDGVELACYKGRGVRFWRTDITDWTAGILENAGSQAITIKTKEGTIRLDYEIIAKAKLDPSQEDYIGH